RSGLFGLPPSTPLPQAEHTPVNGCQGSAPAEGDTEAMQLGTVPPPPACPEPPQPLAPPPPAGSLAPFPPYFEGAPFPPPLWLRNTYRQWVPQPPPRTIKRTRRRLSRNRDPGRLALSPICLRPRRVLCEKFPAAAPAPGGLADVSSGSSGEDDDCKKCPQGKHGRDGLAFLATCPRSRTDCASESVWGSDSLDESKSSSSDTCDLSSGDGMPGPSSSKDVGQTVPPLTVRLHTQSVSRCITEDGRTVAVGDIVWGKIHGFPWWPARVLDISLSQKEDGEPSWQEAKVSWFGSPTTSFLSTSKLSPFSEFFKLRFNRKKKGLYRKAITEAASAARLVGPGVRELLTQCAT
ncbi:PWWP domain-containing protein 2B, partial [Pteropus alecto]|uniref:PWWP domain-containing protein 2B n=1 Tax=Pteropus alecto TaxID=9402 RepID=UPI000D5376C4